MSSKMLLSQEQIALFPPYLELWKNIGLNTESVDTQSAVIALQNAYKSARRPVPKLFLFFESPLQAVIASYLCATNWKHICFMATSMAREENPFHSTIAGWYSIFADAPETPSTNLDFYRITGRNLVQQIADVLKARKRGGYSDTFLPETCGNQINNILKDHPRESFWDDVAAETDNSWPEVNDQLWAAVPDDAFTQIHTCITRVDVGVWSPIQNEIWNILTNLEGQGKAKGLHVAPFNDLWEHIHCCGYGSLDADYLCFYAFFAKELGLNCGKPLYGLRDVIQHCGWWWPFDNVAIYTNRPKELHFDAEDRSHRVDGPSISYRDGFSCYSWKGRRVDRSVVMDPVTVARIDEESNAEVRRVLVERYGAANYVRDSNLDPIHVDEWGTLYRKEQPDDDPIFVVKVICPTTKREYYLGINPEEYGGAAGQNARAAVASTWRKMSDNTLVFATPEEYDPEIQT